MNILVTGAGGFVGKNLCAALMNIKENKDRTRPNITIDEIFEYDLDTRPRCWMNTAPERILYSIWQASTVPRSRANSWQETSALRQLCWIR